MPGVPAAQVGSLDRGLVRGSHAATSLRVALLPELSLTVSGFESRYQNAPKLERPAFLGRVAAKPATRWAFLAVFLGCFFLLDARTAEALPGQSYLIILYSIGILHFWYDSFIWKLRKPAVAANFGIARA